MLLILSCQIQTENALFYYSPKFTNLSIKKSRIKTGNRGPIPLRSKRRIDNYAKNGAALLASRTRVGSDTRHPISVPITIGAVIPTGELRCPGRAGVTKMLNSAHGRILPIQPCGMCGLSFTIVPIECCIPINIQIDAKASISD